MQALRNSCGLAGEALTQGPRQKALHCSVVRPFSGPPRALTGASSSLRDAFTTSSGPARPAHETGPLAPTSTSSQLTGFRGQDWSCVACDGRSGKRKGWGGCAQKRGGHSRLFGATDGEIYLDNQVGASEQPGGAAGDGAPVQLQTFEDFAELAEHSNGSVNGKAEQYKNLPPSTDGMAEAFHIKPRTAFAITTVIAVAALVVPYFMLQGAGATTIRHKVLTYGTLLCGFYMAWNIGANDVANAMGTSVGSGALTLPQAVLTAAVLEFSGAFLVGSHVSHTMQKGILTPTAFSGTGAETLLFCGMLASLAAAGTWLQVASYYGWPVSTTHCIIGALVGFGLAFGGLGAVYWSSLARVVSSWVVSPLMGALVSFFVYKSIRKYVYSSPAPGQAACAAAPVAVFTGVAALSFTSLAGGAGSWLPAALKAVGFGALGAAAIHVVVRRNLGSLMGSFCDLAQKEAADVSKEPLVVEATERKSRTGGPTGLQLRIVYSVFGYLQVLSACFMSFAHGANDVANAIGPISAALAILAGKGLHGDIGVSLEVLAWGGFGIVAGLLVWGYRVIATIGNRITELTPTRGFAAEFAAATVVVIASRLGLPVSATHTLVGAVMGVGFARGLNSIRGETVREIVISWLVTIPIGALLAVVYTFLLLKIVPPLV